MIYVQYNWAYPNYTQYIHVLCAIIKKKKDMTTRTFVDRFNLTISQEGQILINEFFISFARFECALKATGFVSGNFEKVSANWDGFTSSIRNEFDNRIRPIQIKSAIDYLNENPPRIQNYIDGNLAWRDRVFAANQPLINRLSLSIRDIRNNLFHGGKFNGNYQEDFSRNYILLRSAIIVLNYWLELNDDVKRNFLEPIS